MVQDYTAKFTRWDAKRGERRNSPPEFIKARDFAHAYEKARDLLAGMRAGAPEHDYAILAIEARGYGGVNCYEGGHLFETKEEFDARVGGKENG